MYSRTMLIGPPCVLANWGSSSWKGPLAVWGAIYAISLSGRRVVDFWSIVSQMRPLTLKCIHNSFALEYMCSLYHKELQYIAKLRRITIDLYKSRLVT
jgi:hypothetical protein